MLVSLIKTESSPRMLLTKREEQLLKAFLKFGKLSMDNMSEMLGVSKRTVYRTLSDLTNSLATLGIAIIKTINIIYQVILKTFLN